MDMKSSDVCYLITFGLTALIVFAVACYIGGLKLNVSIKDSKIKTFEKCLLLNDNLDGYKKCLEKNWFEKYE